MDSVAFIMAGAADLAGQDSTDTTHGAGTDGVDMVTHTMEATMATDTILT